MTKKHCYVTLKYLGKRVDFTKEGGLPKIKAEEVAKNIKRDMKIAIPKYRVYSNIKVECRKK